ncbi:MAG TPA: xylulokinase [Anaerolineae bacterium]|nr:xylulokinase [Anaerolineae bacterium]
MQQLLLGIDVGTSHVKAALVTLQGQVVAQAQTQYSTQYPRAGWAEQNPEDWWAGVVQATRAVLAESPGSVAGIGVSGQGCAVTLINAQGAVIRPAIIWLDTRSEPQCERLRQCCSEKILRRNGKSPAPYNADPVLMWLQEHEPDSITAARCSLTTTGYINFRLTGAPVENLSDASILFAFDLAQGCWSEELIESFGLPARLYPSLAPCNRVIGTLGKTPATELGLAPGIPVVAGGEDTSSAGLASGAVQPGQVFLSLGTAGTLYATVAEPLVHAQLLTFLHVLPKQWLIGGSMSSVGSALAWCRQLLAERMDFDELTALAAQSEPGANRLLFLPYLSGELQPINDGYARGVFFGLSLNTGLPEFVRAVMEGSAFAIAHNLSIVEALGSLIQELRAVGGPTRSPLWCQIIADVTGRPLSVLANDVGAPLGNALLAAAGTGLIDDPAEIAARSAQVARVFEPDESKHQYYQKLFAIYQELYPQLKAQFAKLNRV